MPAGVWTRWPPHHAPPSHHARCAPRWQAVEGGRRVVIDLDFDDKMSVVDKTHLVQQLSYCYSANKSVPQPAQLVLSSFCGGIQELARQKITGVGWYAGRDICRFV